MNRIYLFFEKHSFIVSLAAIFIVGFGILKMPWQLVDDGKSAQISQILTDSFLNKDIKSFLGGLVEPQSGRFRPLYWIYLWFTFLVFGYQPLGHYILHLVLFITTVWLVFRLILMGGGSRKAAIIGSSLFAIDWRILENWYRLGPQEPLQTPLLLGSIYLFLKQRNTKNKFQLAWSIVLIILAMFLKETNIAFVAIPIYLLISDLILKNKLHIRNDWIYFFFTLMGVIISRFIASSIYPVSGYGSLYMIKLDFIISNLNSYVEMIRASYSPLIEIIIAYFVISIFLLFIKKGYKEILSTYYFAGLFGTFFISFFVIQLPWGFTVGRYLLTAFSGSFIALSLVGERLFSLFDKANRDSDRSGDKASNLFFYMIRFSVILPLVLVIFYNLIMSFNYISWVTKVGNFNDRFIKQIVKSTPENGRVFLNVVHDDNEELELFVEIRWHFDYFYNRKDIVLDYLPENLNLKPEDLVVVHTSAPLVSIDKLNQNKQLEFVTKDYINIENVVLAGPLGFLKEGGKLLTAVSSDKFVNNFYSIGKYTYEWNIYKAK